MLRPRGRRPGPLLWGVAAPVVAPANTAPQQTPVFRLIVTNGGTGGHTYPALTAIRTLQARLAASGRTLDVLLIGTAEGLEARAAAS